MGDNRAISCLTAAIESIRATPFDKRTGEPDPPAYYRALLSDDDTLRTEAIRKEIAYLRDVLAFGGLHELDALEILEVGSGFGIGVITTACLGAGRALGVERVAWQAEWAGCCLDALPSSIARKVEFRVGDATELPFGNESVDVVLSLEAISHYLDYRPFLSEARRVLRPGGVLIVSDGNNGLNPQIRRRTVQLWASHEQPPGNLRTGPSDYPFYFVDKRREIVEEAYPDLPSATALELALRTSGMIRAEVVAAATDYVSTGTMPTSPYEPGNLTVHPTHEMVMERLFNPFRLAREIANCGFRTKVRGHWAGATKRRSLRLANAALAAVTPISIVTARGFRIAAYKRPA